MNLIVSEVILHHKRLSRCRQRLGRFSLFILKV